MNTAEVVQKIDFLLPMRYTTYMISNNSCPTCGKKKHLLLSSYLISPTEYGKRLKCRSCGGEWDEKFSLLSEKNGYSYMWDSQSDKSIPLHRWVWEQANGRALSEIEVIHHKNRNKGDNRLTNLGLMDKYSHNGVFHNSTCQRCGHSWYPRSPEVRICPKCKSPYWDKVRK